MQITFRANIPKAIAPEYKTKQARENTVAVLGSSQTSEDILKHMDMCSNTVKAMVLGGKNVVHGCGAARIMGAAYNAGRNYSTKDENGKPVQSLAVIATPLWGDEDLENCTILTSSTSEADRIEKFAEVADTMLVFPGSAATLQETATLIAKNYYGSPEDKKKIVLVGKEFFKGLDMQYNTLYEAGLIKCRPDELYTLVDSEEEIKKII